MKATYDVRIEKHPNSASDNADHRPIEISSFRRYLPQIVASTVKNFLLLDLGLSVAFPAIIIPALTGIANEHNQNEPLSLTKEQASWLGSIAFICQPIGSIISGWITDPLGRKKAMFIVNVPHVIAWFIMYRATEVWHIFVANVLLGLGIGLMEAPILTYVGEISEPSIRGILTACASISGTLGLFIVYLLNTFMPWRMVGLICLAVPLITMVAICFIPETPLWLLSKNQTEKAEESLRWLRGWVPKANVADEFQALQRYSDRSKACNKCIKQNQKCEHPPPNFVDKMTELQRKRTLKPFVIIMLLSFLSQFTGISAMRPYIVQILKAYETPLSADQATVLLGFMGNVATLLFIAFVRFIGKRRIYLFVLAGTVLSSFIVATYGFICLPSNYTSFDGSHHSISTPESNSLGYIPLVFIILWSFFANAGIIALPWMMLSEIFPFKSRGMATGIAAASNYLFAFVATKTYFNLEMTLSMPGVTLFYCIISVIGLIVMYGILPETEGRTLEDIELHFSDNSLKLTDRNIPNTSAKKMNKNPKDCETNDDPKRLAEKPCATISDMVEMNENATYRKQNNVFKNGCDNKGFTTDSDR